MYNGTGIVAVNNPSMNATGPVSIPIRSRTNKPRTMAIRPAVIASTSLIALICGGVRMMIVGAGVVMRNSIWPQDARKAQMLLTRAGLRATAVNGIRGARDPRGPIGSEI